MNKRIRAHLFLLIVNVIYGANYTIAKNLMREYIQPKGFILLRVIGATTLFVLISPFFKKERIQKKDVPLLALCGLFGVAINQLLFFKGLSLTGVINASLILTTNPMLVLMMAALLLKERITKWKIGGILAGASGAILLILFSNHSDDGKHALAGDVCIFLNAFFYAVYIVLVKPLMIKYHPVTVIKWVFIFGLPVVTVFGYGELSEVQWHTFNANTWMGVSFVVIGSTFIAYLFNIIALKDVSPEVVSIYIYVQPIIATAVSLSVNHESLTMVQVAASILIFTGVYLVSAPMEKRRI